MKIRLDIPKEFLLGAERLSAVLGYEIGAGGITVDVKEADTPGVSYSGERATIYYKSKSQVFRGIGLLVEAARRGEALEVREDSFFKTVGLMQQAVGACIPSVKGAKKLIDYLALMGYNMFMLYTENTLTLENRPYFGYLAGRYSDEDIREIDDYCYEYGIELIPCLECYGHMGAYLRWPEAANIKDTGDVLLARSEETFAFLDEFLGKVSRLFRSRRVHVGMDEAHTMGTGKFLAKHGYVERNIIFAEYMERLAEICKKNGLTPMMWSDMYFRNNNERRWYYDTEVVIPEETMREVPENIELVFWHYGEEEGCDDALLKKHNAFRRPVLFASGTWSWSGHFPETGYAYTTVRDSLIACRENGVHEMFSTVWNKGECDVFCNLLVLSMTAELCYDKNADMEKLKRRFEAVTGGSFEAFFDMALYHNDFKNPEEFEGRYGHHKRFFGKPLFWQDILAGLYDYDLYNRPMSAYYKEAHRKYSQYSGGVWDYMYKYVGKTLELLSVKCEIAEKIAPAYKAGDRETLYEIKDKLLPELYRLTDEVASANRDAWLRCAKTSNLVILDIRYGGAKERIKTSIMLLDEYLKGEREEIEELAEERLKCNFFGFDNYLRIATPGGGV